MIAQSIVTIVALAVISACVSARERGPAAGATEAGTRHSPQSDLAAVIQTAPKLTFLAVELTPRPPHPGWRVGSVSWPAADRDGRTFFLLQRSRDADPIVAIDRDGRVVHSWGAGMYTMPHSIRIDPQGNVWTTDAATSMVYKFTPSGRKLMEIAVGGLPSPCMDQQITPESERASGPNNFCGTTDVAFAPNGHVFITDGYANNRVLEYNADGKRLSEWGSAGTGPGQFRLPHSIVIDETGVIFVSDRENERVQRFDLTGKYLGEWPNLGRIYSLKISEGAIWLVTQPLELPNSASGWMLKLDRATGKLLGYVEITDAHGMDAFDGGQLIATRGGSAWLFQPISR